PIPDGDAVAPPQLTRDVPVPQVVHPLEVRVDPSFRRERDPPLLHGRPRRSLQARHLHEPLLAGEPGLDLRLAAVTATNRVEVGALDADDLPHLLKSFEYARPCLVPIEATELLRSELRDVSVRREDVDRGQAVPLADVEVRRIVGRSDLDRSGPEGGIDDFIGHDRKLTAGERMPSRLADERSIAFVQWVHGDAGVTQHRL